MRTVILCVLVLAGCAVPRPARTTSPRPDVPAGLTEDPGRPAEPPGSTDVWQRPHAHPARDPADPSDEVDVWTAPHAGDELRESDVRGDRAADAFDDAAAAVLAPPIGEVLAAAYTEAGLDHDPTVGWSRRARLAGLVPLVAVRAGRNTKWEELEPDIGYGVTYELRATWRLDRLVFDGREMQAASQQAARRRERSQLVGRVVGLYFAYRRAVAAGHALRAEETAVELDALTGGYFLGALVPENHP